jgi:hypothetical protein
VPDDQDPAAGRVAERAAHRGGQPDGHLAVVLVAAPVEVADVELAEPLDDCHGAGGDDGLDAGPPIARERP